MLSFGLHDLEWNADLRTLCWQTVGAETAAANAEAGKLERDIGDIQASVAQSKIALQSRKERLEVEYVEQEAVS